MNISASPFFRSAFLRHFFVAALLLFFGIFSGFAEEVLPSESPSPSPEISQSSIPPDASSQNPADVVSDNDAIQILRDRQKKIQKSLEKSDEVKKIEQSEEELSTVQAEKENLSEINTEIQTEISDLKKQLEDQKFLESSLQQEKQKNSESAKELSDLQKNIENLQKKISLKDSVLAQNSKDLDRLAQEEEMKKAFLEQSVRYKQKLDDIEAEETSLKYQIFLWVSALFILMTVLRVLAAKRLKESKELRKKYAHRLAAFDVLSVVFYLGFLVWFFFYIKPELVVYLLFLVGAIVMVLQEYLFSMISSVFIVQRYAVGDRIRFGKREGIIEKLTLLKVNVRDIDERGTDISELRVIPNSQFMKETVSILPRCNVERFDFKIVLPNDLSINEPVLVQRIEENILQKNITVKSFNELTEKEYFYDIDFHFTSTGHPVIELFWYETREKSNRIKRKILAEIETIKKEACVQGDAKVLPEEISGIPVSSSLSVSE